MDNERGKKCFVWNYMTIFASIHNYAVLQKLIDLNNNHSVA